MLLALTPVAERAIEHLLFGEHAGRLPVASVGEADELEASVREQTADAVLISPQLSGLSTGHCERVRAMGLRLIGVALDEHDRQDLQSLRDRRDHHPGHRCRRAARRIAPGHATALPVAQRRRRPRAG